MKLHTGLRIVTLIIIMLAFTLASYGNAVKRQGGGNLAPSSSQSCAKSNGGQITRLSREGGLVLWN
jgi:hypothetical protein